MSEFASADLTMGQLNALVKKLGGRDNVLRALREELAPSELIRFGRKRDGTVRFNVTSDGTLGKDWQERLSACGTWIDEGTRYALRSPDFKPTCGVTTEVVVYGSSYFTNSERTDKFIRSTANQQGFVALNPEAACLAREKFSNKEFKQMGMSGGVVFMHEPIVNPQSFQGASLFFIAYGDNVDRALRTLDPVSGNGRYQSDNYGFAFAAPSAS